MKIYEHFALNGPEISYKKVGINWKDLTDKMDTSKAVKELGVPEKTESLRHFPVEIYSVVCWQEP